MCFCLFCLFVTSPHWLNTSTPSAHFIVSPTKGRNFSGRQMFTLHLRHIMGRGELLVNFHGLVWVEATSLGVNIEPGLQSVLYPFHLASSTEGFCSCTVCTAHYYVGLGAGFSYFPTSLVVNSEICIICIKFISHFTIRFKEERVDHHHHHHRHSPLQCIVSLQ